MSLVSSEKGGRVENVLFFQDLGHLLDKGIKGVVTKDMITK